MPDHERLDVKCCWDASLSCQKPFPAIVLALSIQAFAHTLSPHRPLLVCTAVVCMASAVMGSMCQAFAVQHCIASFPVHTSVSLIVCLQLKLDLCFQMSSISHTASLNAMQHAQQHGSGQDAALRNTYGGAFPARMALDRQILTR